MIEGLKKGDTIYFSQFYLGLSDFPSVYECVIVRINSTDDEMLLADARTESFFKIGNYCEYVPQTNDEMTLVTVWGINKKEVINSIVSYVQRYLEQSVENLNKAMQKEAHRLALLIQKYQDGEIG